MERLAKSWVCVFVFVVRRIQLKGQLSVINVIALIPFMLSAFMDDFDETRGEEKNDETDGRLCCTGVSAASCVPPAAVSRRVRTARAPLSRVFR